MWLTDEERRENERRDREAQRRGYSSAYDEEQQRSRQRTDDIARQAAKRLTREEWNAVRSTKRDYDWLRSGRY